VPYKKLCKEAIIKRFDDGFFAFNFIICRHLKISLLKIFFAEQIKYF